MNDMTRYDMNLYEYTHSLYMIYYDMYVTAHTINTY